MRVRQYALAVAALVCVTAALPAQGPDRTKPPALGPLPSLRLPPVKRFTLSNGLTVVLLEKHEVPLVQLNLVVKAGAAMDPAAKSGLASLTAAMLDEGAGNRNALDLADAVEFLGARLTTGAGMHTSVVQMHTPLARLDSALGLLADVTVRPTFPAEELERQRKERLTTLTQWRDQPRAIASVIFNRTLYGNSHPYGLPTQGNAATLGGMSVTDLRSFHSSYYRPANAAIVIVGDVTADAIRPKLEAAFAAWGSGTVPTSSWPAPKQVATRDVFLVDKPGAPQSEIRIGRIGVPRLTEDYFPLIVLNTVLGGSFTSRLNQNLREEHGYSYGAFSMFDFRPQPGPFLASAAVQTNVTDKALTEFMKEIRNISTVTDDELNRAKNYVALQFPQDFQSVSAIAAQLQDLVVYGLPNDYFDSYINRVTQVPRADIERVAKKYIDPERVAIIVVGDRAQVEQGIRNLKLGQVRSLTVDDVLGKQLPGHSQ